MNEINFRINYNIFHIIIMMKTMKKHYIININNRDFIIFIKYINIDYYNLFVFLIIIKI